MTAKLWELYRDNDDIDLCGKFATKNEAINHAKWANEGSDYPVVFSYNYTHKVWDSGDYTVTKNGHPQLKANAEYDKAHQVVEQ